VTLVVFTGPTLAADEVRAELPDAVVLPPAAQGDLYRAALGRPTAIGLVDGYFERVPAVWHKEILWAMAQGIHVFGAASMGALRAAELAPFGMIGIGDIAAAFTSGELEDDDEVAVAHGPAEGGYRASSEAMVNLRATFAAAVQENVIDDGVRGLLVRVAKALYYADRAYPSVLAAARAEGAPAAPLDALAAWLPRGRVNQKRADALAMLSAMRDHVARAPGPMQATFAFEHTEVWERLVRETGAPRAAFAATSEAPAPDGLVEELGVLGRFPHARVAALARVLALDESRRQGFRPSPELVQVTADTFRRERGLHGPDDVLGWLRDEGLDDAALTRLLDDETRVRWVETALLPDVLRALPDHLRLSGGYAALVARLTAKQRVLAERGLENPSLADAGVTEEALWEWYHGGMLAVPRPADLHAWAQSAGFESVDDLRRAVLRQWWFERVERSPS